MKPRSLAALAVAVAVIAGAALWFRQRTRAPIAAPAPVLSASATAVSTASARPNPHPPSESRALLWPFESPRPAVVPLHGGPEELAPLRAVPPEARRAEHRRRAADGGAQPPGYPPSCQPAARAASRILPRHPFPVVRPLAQGALQRGLALLRAVQDRDRLVVGDAARLTLEVAVDGARVPFEIKNGELRKPGPAPGAQSETVAPVVFRDDGVSPDEKAKDGIQTASVALGSALEHFTGDVSVRAEISTAKETGEIVFPFVAAGPPPAEFSGSVREAIEDGALALYVGVRVKQAGQYDFTGRLYDSEHRAMAVFDTTATLDPSAREVRLEVCGRVLAGEGVAGPWELRDVEGYFRGQVAGRPDLIPMRILKGPHRTRVYSLESFR